MHRQRIAEDIGFGHRTGNRERCEMTGRIDAVAVAKAGERFDLGKLTNQIRELDDRGNWSRTETMRRLKDWSSAGGPRTSLH
jgi:hypothetical protein